MVAAGALVVRGSIPARDFRTLYAPFEKFAPRN
jgi:hypothetical protein